MSNTSDPRPAAQDSPVLRFKHPRTARLRRQKDFARVYSQGSRARADLMIVVAAPSHLGSEASARLGLSVGKRIWKSAVKRNRVRRIFREAFRLERSRLPVGVDLILIPAQPRLDPALEDTRAELVKLSHKAYRRMLEKHGGKP